jgi:thioredoxin reductase (NADPH)
MRASAAMQAKLTSNDKIEILWYTEATEVLGDGNKISAINIVNNQTGETSTLEAAGLFFAIGHTPNTAFLGGQVPTDENGYIYTFGRISQEHISGEKRIPEDRLEQLR